MGLDMYFTANRYLASYDENDANIKSDVSKVASAIFDTWEVKEITYEVGYWRKANQIHNWFVRNVQDGVDNCQPHYVGYDNIIALYDTVCKVLDDHTKAGELLPTESGFFFGSTSYDEYYYEDLEHTKEILEPIIEKLEYARDNPSIPHNIYNYEFYYRSSW